MDSENKEQPNPDWVDAPYEAIVWDALTGEFKIVKSPEELRDFFVRLNQSSL